MSDRIQRIGLLTGGGDCPGLNAVIRATVKIAIHEYGWEVLGIEDGFEGLIQAGKARLWKPAPVRCVGRKRTIDHFESLNSRFGIPQAVMARGKATAA